MKILLRNSDLNEAILDSSNVGFVPTMGSLHKGHISLIKKSLICCSKTVVSIFVNPTQFNKKKDYLSYPRNFKKDLQILKKLKVDYLFLPEVDAIYSKKRKTKIKLNKSDNILCAKFRKGHFEGVIDVMDRLSKKIKPKKIYLGEKDFQQLFLLKKYLGKKYKYKIIPCKTIRNSTKLALSSRNLLLKKNQLYKAGKFAQDIIFFKKRLIRKIVNKDLLEKKKKELTKKFNVDIEYFELRNLSNLKKSNTIEKSRIFISYYLNKVRLIDNF